VHQEGSIGISLDDESISGGLLDPPAIPVTLSTRSLAMGSCSTSLLKTPSIHSGLQYYEPSTAIPLNNASALLSEQEGEEERRALVLLSRMVRERGRDV
jgi:hypothetical protein